MDLRTESMSPPRARMKRASISTSNTHRELNGSANRMYEIASEGLHLEPRGLLIARVTVVVENYYRASAGPGITRFAAYVLLSYPDHRVALAGAGSSIASISRFASMGNTSRSKRNIPMKCSTDMSLVMPCFWKVAYSGSKVAYFG